MLDGENSNSCSLDTKMIRCILIWYYDRRRLLQQIKQERNNNPENLYIENIGKLLGIEPIADGSISDMGWDEVKHLCEDFVNEMTKKISESFQGRNYNFMLHEIFLDLERMVQVEEREETEEIGETEEWKTEGIENTEGEWETEETEETEKAGKTKERTEETDKRQLDLEVIEKCLRIYRGDSGIKRQNFYGEYVKRHGE
ncbi:MAG: hypothetical protein OSJ52_10645 [Lachnospiraceae bacterium]|nr:hypothetical protein [Lachnospiraceae bacterium]